jgi:uncharacterized protein (TIGR02996 family)
VNRAELFEAVLQSPHDDLPRLVFADWLDDHGEPERAEFIRLQIQLATQLEAQVEQRCRELLERHRSQWIIPGLRGVQEFRRGFVDSLRIAGPEFAEHAERIGAAAPITRLRVPVALEHLREIAEVPWLHRLSHLDLTGNVGFVGQMDWFFEQAGLSGLKSLALRNVQIWPDDVPGLVGIVERWPGLIELNLSGNPIGDEGLAHLAVPAKLPTLERLILRCDEVPKYSAIGEWGIVCLVKNPLKSLRELDLAGHAIDQSAFSVLALSRGFPLLQSLDLSHNDILLTEAEWVVRLIESSSLERLNLEDNEIAEGVMQALEEHPSVRRLKEFRRGMRPRDWIVV